jgi:hypothetical protein
MLQNVPAYYDETYKGFTREGSRELNSNKHQTSSHERLLAVMAIRDIRKALDQLEIFKVEEWNRQYKVAKDCCAPVIDTCKD